MKRTPFLGEHGLGAVLADDLSSCQEGAEAVVIPVAAGRGQIHELSIIEANVGKMVQGISNPVDSRFFSHNVQSPGCNAAWLVPWRVPQEAARLRRAERSGRLEQAR